MKINAKLLVVAFILAIFSIGAVAASENATIGSSELTQVPHEQVVSVSEPTVPEVETTDIETSAKDTNVNEVSLSSDNNCTDSYQKESLRQVKKGESLLGASNSEDILGANTITPAGTKFYNIRDAIENADEGDIIDLGGLTYTGILASNLATSKKVTIQNGIIDGTDVTSASQIRFDNVIIKDIHFTNFNFKLGKWSRVFFFVDSTLENVKFTNSSQDTYMGMFSGLTNTKAINVVYDGIVSGTCVADIKYSNLTNVNFTNSRVTDDTKESDTGQFTVIIGSILDNCNFINTSSKQHSGAICMARGENTVINSNFINCTAWIGGAIYAHGDFVEGNKKYTIENCKFINCHAEEEGGALGLSHNNMDVKNCVFINNTATKGAGIMVGGINYPTAIHGDNTHGHNITVDNCYFENNFASKEGGAVHISGDNNTIINSKFYYNEAPEGGAVHIVGDNASALDSIFDDNFANGGKGAAIYVKGNYSAIDNTKFTNHDSEMGTVYIEGNYFNCTNSVFTDNTADHGGAGIYVEGDYSYVYKSSFENNNASRHGGAIHTIGSHTKIYNSEFRNNHAIPSVTDEDYGLGGAIYINGRDNEISYSKFKYNTARNGSAIYNNGDDLILNDDTFEKNQAWSYFLFTEAKPPEAYWDDDLEMLVNLTLVAGDNLINAIYNNKTIYDIYFHNVTYTLNPTEHYPTGIRTTTPAEIHPVDGVENSLDGRILYQDAREDDQVINVNVTYKNGLVYEYGGKTNRYGNVLIALKKENLTDGQFHPGIYTVTAEHPDDDIYTSIRNSTTFTIYPHVDVSVTKTSNKDIYVVGENAVFTIRVYSVGTNATNVKVRDILPDSFKYVDSQATQGEYNSTSNIWDIGFMPHGSSQTLTLTVQTTELGIFNNVVNVTCTEKDWNLSNNIANKTIKVDLHYTKEANVTNTSAGEYFEYYLRVFNIGDSTYNETLRIRDVLPEGVQYTGIYELQGADLVKYINYGFEQIWEITNISAGTRAKITIKVKALKDGVWNNTMYVWNYPPANATVNVSSSADLRVVKDVSTKTANKGDLINWTIFVKNEGPSIAMGAYVEDILPAGLEIYGMTIASKGSYNRNDGRWTIGDMAVGEIQNLIITTRVTVSSVNITNEAIVNGTTHDPNPDNNYDNETIEVTPEGDVGVEKTVSVHNVYHGQIVYWTIVVTNYGPDTATGVFVTDVLPSGLDFINSTKSKGKDYNPISGNWDIGELAKGENATLTIYTRATEHNKLINNVATVNTTSIDTNPKNNKDDDYINIGPEADLELIKVVNKHEVVKGDIVIWTITVINHGPNDAIDAYVDDILPKGLEFISSSSPRRYDNNTGRWDIGHLSNGSNATLTIVTKVLASNEIIKNYAITNSSTHDPDPYNNDDEDGIIVKTEADVGIIKVVSNKTAHYGDTVLWTINVTNYGPNIAENVIVTDLLPAGLIIIGSPSHSQGHVYVDGSGNGIWNIGDLAVNETVSAIINSKINTTDATIVNVVEVNTTSHDPNPSNDIAENRTVISPEADVEVIKTVNNVTPNKGDTIVWTITVINHGPDLAENVIVTDILPAGVEYVSHQGSYHRSTGVWDVGSLVHKETKTLNITTKVVDTGKITNEVNVTTTTYDTDLTNNYDNETIDVPAIADLVITKEVSNKTPKFGDLINWTITVTNNGPNNARNVVVNDKLPNGLIYETHNATKGLYDSVQGIWQIGDVLHFDTVKLIITTRVNVTNTTITNIAVVTSTTPDSNETNNKANNTTNVGPVADLAIEKIVNNHGPKKGDEITWTITVTNNGPDAAINAVAKDILPAGLIFVKADGNGTYNSQTNLWTIGDIENKGVRLLNITTKVDVTKSVITNVVNVTSDTPDPDDSNNEDNATIDVGHETDLEVIKTVSNSTPRNGDTIIWNITVINHGPDDAIETIVNDKLPAGLIWISDDSNGAYNHITGIWNIGILPHNTNVTLLIETLVNASGVNITNIANVTTDTHDTNESNNEDNDTVEVPADPKADLSIIKQVSNKTPRKGDEITWTITVTNNGPDTAYNVTVNDKLPAGLVYKTDDSNGKYNQTTGVWTIGELANTKSVSLVITTLVNITNTTITNVANVTSTTPDPNDENNKANNNTTVAPEADLEIVKLVSNATVKKGDIITWTITVTNNGPDTALNIYVMDELPKGLVLNGYSKTKGLFDSDTFTWFIPSLAKGESQNLTLRTLVNVTNRTLVNTANVTNDVYDPNTTNNEANNNTTVVPEADLEVIKTAMNSTVKKGDVLGWNITIINHGPDTVSEISIADKAQTGLVFVDNHGRLINGQIITDKIKVNLQAGQSMTIYVTTWVNASNVNLTNEFAVKGDIYDPNLENNYDNDTVEVLPRADIVVEKTVSSNVTRKGEEITWTIKVTNNGPDTAVNTRVTDKLPKGDLIYNGHKADVGNYDPESGVWIVGDLASGVSKTLTIKTIVNITNKTIINVANVTSDTPGNKTNDTDNTTSVPEADLEVIKTAMNATVKMGDVVVWNITIINHGPDTVTQITVFDDAQKGLIFVGQSGQLSPQQRIMAVIGVNLGVGQSTTVYIKTLVNASNVNLTNEVAVIGNVYDPNPDNNRDNDTVEVPPVANIVVEKTVSSNVTKFGEEIIWTIKVTNNGPDTAVNTRVTDKLPKGDLIYNGHKADVGNYDPESGVWIVGDLANGVSKTLTIKTIVNITNKTIINVANVTSDTPGNKTNDTDNTTSEPKADLVVVKEVSNKNPRFGEEITWTVTVTNKGPDAAVNVTVTDKLPAGLIFVKSNGNYNATTGVWTVGDLADGESKSLAITTLVNITNATIENIANATSDTPGNNTPGNNTTDVGSIADLEIIKLVSNSTAKTGDVISWTIIVTNNGPDVAKGVNVSDKLPAGLTYKAHKADYGVYDPSQGIWIIGDMANGKSYSLVISTAVDIVNGTIENVAVVNSSTPDNNTDNNKANNNTTVNENADLIIVKEVSNKNPHKGDIITWTITVTNKGPSEAKNVKVTDKLPEGLVFKGSNGAYNPESGVWTVGDLADGESKSLVITTLVNITNRTITNVANVTSDTPDSNKTNNVANNTTDVAPEADLEVIKTVSNSTPKKGDIITWTITVTNNGPDVAVNVRIVDTIPEGLLVVGDSMTKPTSEVIIEIPKLDAGKSAEFTIKTLVNVTNATLRNVVVANSTTYDPNETNNKDNETAEVPAEADLEIIKLVSNATAHKGDIIIWTVKVTNNGPDVAEKVYVNDILPNGLVYKAHNANKGLFDSNKLVWFIESLANGETQTLTIETLVNTTNTKITNIVNVTSDTPDSNKTNNVANNTTDVPPEADIGVVKEVNATECVKDQIVEWKITMTNHGPDGATDVVVKDNLPDTLIFISADGNYNPQTGIWTIDYLASGETRVLTIITKVNTTGMVIVNNVTVTSGVYDPDMSNNKASNNTTVVKETLADLVIVKEVSNKNPHKGDAITWTITVTNNGPDSAKDVIVTDKLPAGLIFKDSNGNYNPATGVWTVGDLENGKSASLIITTVVDITNSEITNVAVVNSSTPDNNTDNNKDNDTTVIDPEADISVIKTVSNPTPKKGDVITWTIVVTNFGPDVAKDVAVVEALPEGLQLMAAKGSKGAYENGIWTIGELKNHEQATLTLTTKVTVSGGTIENIVVASSSTHDSNKTNNNDTEVTNPKPVETSADLEITKVANVKAVKVGDNFIWTITVTNHGPDVAKNVRVIDWAVGDFELLDVIASKGEFDVNTGIWAIGDMKVGDTVSLKLICKALSDVPAVNHAIVESDTPDPNEDNNHDMSTVDVYKPTPDAPVKHNVPNAPVMHATGNPIVMVLLALLAIVGVTLRKRN